MRRIQIFSVLMVMFCVCGVNLASGLSPEAMATDVGDGEFSMRIMDVFSITGRGVVLTGQITSGSIVEGDPVCIPLKNGETAARAVDGIEIFRKVLDRAEKGQNVGLLVQIDKKQVEKGALLHGNCELEDGDLTSDE